MRAALFERPGQPLGQVDLPTPTPGPHQLLLSVRACAVCRADLHIVDGELTAPKRPLLPGHEVIGTVSARGPGSSRFQIGDRVGVPWLGWTCGACWYCRDHQENLCDRAGFTVTRSTEVPVKTQVETFRLEEANAALSRLRDGKVTGAAVLVMD